MSLYGDYRQWADQRYEQLESGSQQQHEFLLEQMDLNAEMLTVCDMLATVTQDQGSLWGKLKRYVFFLRDPLKGVRSEIRGIRERWS